MKRIIFFIFQHDTTLIAALQNLGIYDGKNPPFASAFFIELHKTNDGLPILKVSLKMHFFMGEPCEFCSFFITTKRIPKRSLKNCIPLYSIRVLAVWRNTQNGRKNEPQAIGHKNVELKGKKSKKTGKVRDIDLIALGAWLLRLGAELCPEVRIVWERIERENSKRKLNWTDWFFEKTDFVEYFLFIS